MKTKEENFKQRLLRSDMTKLSKCVLTKTFQFNLETRRPLVNSAFGNGLEADGQGLRIEKNRKKY